MTIQFDFNINLVDILSLTLATIALIWSVRRTRRSTSPSKISLMFQRERLIDWKRIEDSHGLIMQFFVSAEFRNSGGTATGLTDIYPLMIRPPMTLDEHDHHPNQTYWYILPILAARTPLTNKILEGHGVLPLKIEMRLYFDSEQEARKSLSNKNQLVLRLNYKWSNSKDGAIVSDFKDFHFNFAHI